MTLTKEHIIDGIYKHTDLPRTKSTEVLESCLEIIKSTLGSGEDVLISGFGKFCVEEKNERRGRNPHTGDDLMLGARRIVMFKCSPVLGNKVSGKGKE